MRILLSKKERNFLQILQEYNEIVEKNFSFKKVGIHTFMCLCSLSASMEEKGQKRQIAWEPLSSCQSSHVLWKQYNLCTINSLK